MASDKRLYWHSKVFVAAAMVLVILGAAGAAYGLSGGPPNPVFSMDPTSWAIEKQGVVISPDDAPESLTNAYNIGVIRLPSGDIWAYAKGDSSAGTQIYGWKSADDGVSFEIQNGGRPVVARSGRAWDNANHRGTYAVYEASTDTIHLYYTGRGGWPRWDSVGHATAKGLSPANFDLDSRSPILTPGDMESLGLGYGGYLAVSDMVQIDGEFRWYGWMWASVDGVKRWIIWQATGDSWSEMVPKSIIFDATDWGYDYSDLAVGKPSVIGSPDYSLYSMLLTVGPPGHQPKTIVSAWSMDGDTWHLIEGTVIEPSGDELRAGFGTFLKESQPPYAGLETVNGLGHYYYSGATMVPRPVYDTSLAHIVPVAVR